MTGPLSSRAMLTLLLVAPALGCAAKPPEKPIVLRSHHLERRLVRRPRPPEPTTATATGTATAPEDAAAGSLSPGEKDTLFRNFETFLSRTGQAP